MAFSLTNDIAPLVFSSAFAELKFTTDVPAVRFALLDGEAVIWEATLYAYAGSIVLFDLSSIMELYMRQHGLAYRAFKIRASSGTTVLYNNAWGVIYCMRRFNGDVADLSTRMFLSTVHSKMSFVGSVEQVARYGVQGKEASEKLEVVYENKAGAILETTIHRNNGTFPKTDIYFSSVDYNSLLASLKASKILSVMLTAGKRAFTFYYGVQPTIAFLFRNAFNVIEMAPMFGTIKRITEVAKSTATCNGIDSFYDQKDTHTYELESADLTLHQAQWLAQLCTAHDVWLYTGSMVPDDFYKVNIIDHTSEVSDSDDKLNELKLKFKFPDGRTLIADINEQSADDIFTYQYQLQFS